MYQAQKTAARVVIAALVALTPGGNSHAVAQLSPQDAPFPSCVVGYPEAPEADDRTVSRYEFAATLTQCLNLLEEEMELQLENTVPRSEVEETTQRQQHLNAELEEIDNRLDELLGEPESPPDRSSVTSEGQTEPKPMEN